MDTDEALAQSVDIGAGEQVFIVVMDIFLGQAQEFAGALFALGVDVA